MDALVALGAAALTEQELAITVGDLLGLDGPADVTECVVEPVDYAVPAITTLSRHWVRGTALVEREPRQWAMFVKQVQCWSRHPFFAGVPAEAREFARASVPWRTEPEVYRTDLRERLPEGLDMPRALRVDALDNSSAAIWLPRLVVEPARWTVDHFARQARLLGRFAASPGVREVAGQISHQWSASDYVRGRLALEVFPILRSDVWEHPVIRLGFDAALRERVIAAVDRVGSLGDELDSMPLLAAHSDASANNLLSVRGSNATTLIDFGFFGLRSIGFDLSQLLLGDLQLGQRSVDDPAPLEELDERCLEEYAAGAAEEGEHLALDLLRRAHALQLLIFSGVSALPVELLEVDPTPAVLETASARAVIMRHALDLVERTD